MWPLQIGNITFFVLGRFLKKDEPDGLQKQMYKLCQNEAESQICN